RLVEAQASPGGPLRLEGAVDLPARRKHADRLAKPGRSACEARSAGPVALRRGGVRQIVEAFGRDLPVAARPAEDEGLAQESRRRRAIALLEREAPETAE